MQKQLRRRMSALALVVPLTIFFAGCNDDDNITGLDDQQQIITSITTDADIMGVLHQSNLNEINAGNLALSAASDAEVRSFGQMMVTDHTNLDQQGSALAASLGIVPVLRDTTLVRQGHQEMAKLSGKTGTTFDRQYITQQVQDHLQTLAIIDAALQVTTNTSLRTMLQNQVRPAVASHLQLAQSIQARIGQ
jgi:putative membrane protein